VHVGLQLTELEAMEVALIPSANNYAASLSTWAYGSQAKFLVAAHAWLKKNGLTSTTFIEPTGIDPANTSTASDLVALGKLAHANPVLAQITSTKKLTVAGVGTIKNTNGLLGLGGVTGLKTGTLDSFGANLLFSANERVGTRTVTLIGVVLGAKTHPILDKDLKVILAGVIASFHDVSLTTKGEKFGTFSTAWGSTALVAEKSKTVLVWGQTKTSLRVTASKVAVGAKGTDVGTATFTVNGETIKIPLELATTVADPGAVWRLTHPSELL
jgi:D-alanyl-D-alanine carboxypeptidase (penicillin-binding protein 5/6)